MKPLYAIYLLLLMLCSGVRIFAQGNSTPLQATYATTESRCRATGVIIVNASGGSGSYNYKASGPVNTPYTSSRIISGLEAGTYTVTIKDVVTGVELEQPGVVVNGSYADPRFSLTSTDVTCAGNDGSITTGAVQNGRAPFTYTIVAPSPSGVGTANTNGSFNNLTAGEYTIRMTDSCGGIQVRTVRVEGYSWWFDGASVTRAGCNEGDAVINLKNNKGQTNASGSAFSGFMYGVVQGPGDTIWGTQRTFRFWLGKRRSVVLVSKDPCGTITPYNVSVPTTVMPALSTNISVSDRKCSTFDARATGQQNLTNPQYCLFNSGGVQVACNTTGTFDDIAYGAYTMRIRDTCYDTTIVRSFSAYAGTPSVSNTVAVSNLGCTTFTATITGKSNLFNPQFCIYDAGNVQLECNTTGVFNNLPYGTYTIQTTDGCTGNVITRTVSASKLLPTITNVSTGANGCNRFNVQSVISTNGGTNPQYCLYDNNGNLIACNSTGQFNDLPYGSYCMRLTTSCGDVSAPYCFTRNAPVPSVATAVTIDNTTCNTFRATITGQTNLTNPQYCIYNSSNVLLTCNYTGVFDNLPYGTYTINTTDGCTGAVISRTVSAGQPQPTLNTTVGISNSTCASFTASVNGTNLTSPVYRAYDGANNLVATNTTGVFSNLSYGSYCFEATDGCTGAVLRVCETVTNTHAFSVTALNSCNIGTTNIRVQFVGAGSPFRVQIIHPNGTVIRDVYSAADTLTVTNVPALSVGEVYSVMGTNSCGQIAQTTIAPDATVVSKTVAIQNKCPGAQSQYGSGDVTINCSSNYASVTPVIVAKDGAAYTQTHSTNSGNTFVFGSLLPATYVIEYSIQGCSTKLWDTVTVPPYTYPSQDRSAIYQCDNSGFSLGASVMGGIGPYQYEIIGSMPQSPSIVTPPQSSPVFNINNGTVYSLVRLRTIDACGNGTLNDVSVLPLQNIAIKASQTCLYQAVMLTVDTIPNATYTWYLKQSATDSVLVDSAMGHLIPFLRPEQTGTYVCKMSVNAGCATQVTYFNITGQCDGQTLLAAKVQLEGRRMNGVSVLNWQALSEEQVEKYVLEKQAPNGSFIAVDSIASRRSSQREYYNYIDKKAAHERTIYRLRIVDVQGKVAYSNSVEIDNENKSTGAQPNPVQQMLYITWNNEGTQSLRIDWYNTAGQLVHKLHTGPQQGRTLVLQRPAAIKRGVYLMHCTNEQTGERKVYRLLFE